MPSFNDIHQRPLQFATGTANSTDITSGAPCRILAFTLTFDTVAPGTVRLFKNTDAADTTTNRNDFRVTAEVPTVVKTWGPQGLTATGITISNIANSPTWTVLYVED